ncbi:MAG: putative peptidoglycan lipid II flippase, partial [Candidatus Midichloriaceae bacterium]
MLSRIFGFLRDMVIASKLGTGIYNDAFVAAFKLANMFRNIFSEGALSAAFIPEFSKVLKEKGKKDALIFASQIHSLLIISLFIFCVLIIIFMPEVIWYTTPGFRDDMHIYNLTVLFGRITFPYLLFISIASFYGGVLNAFNKFFAFSFAPIILNISCIIGLSLFDNLDTSSHTLSIATLVGGVLELLWMLFFLIKYNCGVSIIKIKMTPEVIRTLKKMVPIIISSGVMHINSWVSMVILSFFTGGLSYMYYADRIVHLPLALIGTAAGTVLLPKLAQRNDKNTSNIENHSIKFVLFLAIPATFALMLMSYDIIEILFQRDEFSSNSTRETA